jgi:carbon-monoxide dehydrogenase medium subunit
MRPLPKFNLHRPGTLKEALRLLKEKKSSKPIAGGTDLLIDLRNSAYDVDHLVDLGRVEELDYVKETEGTIHIGAMTTHVKITSSLLIKKKAFVLSEAASKIGSVQTRNVATIGGNLCNASPGADIATPLLVLDAIITAVSLEGSRSMPLNEFFTGPKFTILEPWELLLEIRFSTPPPGSGSAFLKLGRRKGCTLSLINAAAYIETEGNTIKKARVAFGACAPTPIRVPEVEEMLKGNNADEKVIDEVSSACYGLVQPSQRAHSRASEEYRREMSCILMKRALNAALERARS